MNRLTSLLAICSLLVALSACDKESPSADEVEEVPDALAGETGDRAAVESDDEVVNPEDGAASAPKAPRVTFHAGRFSMNVPGEAQGQPELEETETRRKSSQEWASDRAVISVSVDEGLIESDSGRFDSKALEFFEARQTRSFEEVLERKQIELAELETTARYVLGREESGKRSHLVFVTPDPYTLMMIIVLERAEVPTEEVLAMVRSLKVEKSQARTEGEAEEIDLDELAEELAARGQVSQEDVENQPRSREPGQPSVANSCNLMTRECYETAHSAVGEGFYSDEVKCMGDFSGGPCPSEDRVGFCRLNESQLISFYAIEGKPQEEREAASKKTCETTYKGTWLGMPEERPWPQNKTG